MLAKRIDHQDGLKTIRFGYFTVANNTPPAHVYVEEWKKDISFWQKKLTSFSSQKLKEKKKKAWTRNGQCGSTFYVYFT